MIDPARWQLAQFNVARLLVPIDHPQVADFVDNLDRVNELAEATPGFVWRLQSDSGNATDIEVEDDEMMIVNMSVWADPESLFDFTYRTSHAEIMRRRAEWFEARVEMHLVLWWVPAGHEPSLDEALDRLGKLRANGPTSEAFTLRDRFDPPVEA
ncbi:MAG: DUF3291 domain-containing protein [Acidimicrobiia bacterium]|nr:DUF3291 domain-containing protein [Acidimicrobiia bacterium]